MSKQKKVIVTLVSILVLCLLGFVCFLFLLDSSKESKEKESQKETTTKEDKTEKETTKETTKEEETTTKSQDVFMVSYVPNGSWEKDGFTCTQFNVTVYNRTNTDAEGWQIILTVPADSVLEQSWNATCEKSEDHLTIIPEDYNSTILANGSVSMGFILDTKGEYKPENSTLTVNGKDYTMNGGGQSPEEKSTTGKEDSQMTSANPENGTKTPLQLHGSLSVKGTNLVDKDGNPFQLKGVSTHGIAWFPQYVNKDSFQTLRDSFGVNTIRLAMYSNPADGYTTNLHETVKTGVDAACELGMYCIIDWHILNDNNPNTEDNIKRASTFFTEMANTYKDKENIIYEICNEPNGNVTWEDDIKPYAQKMIQTIRAIDSDAIIIVGTPTWSQDVDLVAKSPISGESNLMYALHFYAATHKEDLRNKATNALNAGLPILISEFSICDASGNGALDTNSASEWFNLIRNNKLSCVAWNLSNKDESSSLLLPSCDKTSGFTESDLSEAAKYIFNQYKSY